MILSDSDLRQIISSKKLVIEPLSSDTVQQNGIDLKTSDKVAVNVSKSGVEFLDSTSGEEIKKFYETITNNDGYFVLSPLRHYLFSTRERLELPNDVVGFCGLRSTFARLGFISPLTIVDAGFEGTLTIGMFYGGSNQIKIPVDCRFLHVVFAKLSTQVRTPNRGYYQGQKGIEFPKSVT